MNGGRRRRQTLNALDLATVSIARRERRIRQIEETATALHKIGITWGDIKPENVFINSVTDEPWLIDFGGGCSAGWARPEGNGTVVGGLATVQRVAKYLRLEEQYRLAKILLASMMACGDH